MCDFLSFFAYPFLSGGMLRKEGRGECSERVYGFAAERSPGRQPGQRWPLAQHLSLWRGLLEAAGARAPRNEATTDLLRTEAGPLGVDTRRRGVA